MSRSPRRDRSTVAVRLRASPQEGGLPRPAGDRRLPGTPASTDASAVPRLRPWTLALATAATAFGALAQGLTAQGAPLPRPAASSAMVASGDPGSPQARAMQADDSQNPGMLWVKDGELAWQRREGRAQKACADCHGDATRSMRGVAARHPAFDRATGRPIDLGQRIDRCRSTHQGAAPWAPESDARLAMEAFVGHQSRGLPIAPPEDARLAPFIEHGRAQFQQRQGQLDLSCAQCHDALAGQRLGGALIPRGDPQGYPIYRLEWQALGSLQRRLRNCLTGVRAEPLPFGDDSLVALELYLKQRARGTPIETPGVRP